MSDTQVSPPNPFQANPFQANPFQADPYQADPYQADPYQADHTAQLPGAPVSGDPITRDPMPPEGSILPPPLPATPNPPPAPGGRGFTAGVLAAALLAGAAGGVAGAAAWETWRAEPASSTATTAPANTKATRPLEPAPRRATTGSVEQVAQDVLPSVVQINVSGAQGEGAGSGVILTSGGRILTNNHVVEPAGAGGTLSVSFNDGTRASAKVVGTDPLTDSAVIQATGVSDLTPADIGRSADVRVGQDVVAIGSPYGLDASVTSGIVSALNRPVTVGRNTDGNQITYPALQTDAAINPGNSGGPLVDMAGRVVGINSSIRSTGSVVGQAGSIGLGFAIPIDELMPIVDQIVAGETPTHARLGIGVSSVGDTSEVIGAQVGEVNPGSAAEGAGLKSGDVITQVDDIRIADSESLIATIRSFRPGDRVQVTFVRDGQEKTISLALDSD
ncbi:MAG: S1C family serine protease [Nocardioides sp.]